MVTYWRGNAGWIRPKEQNHVDHGQQDCERQIITYRWALISNRDEPLAIAREHKWLTRRAGRVTAPRFRGTSEQDEGKNGDGGARKNGVVLLRRFAEGAGFAIQG
jgi:hypothetical protein